MNKGGFRKGSGRKLGSGRYGHPTVLIRVPDYLEEWVLQIVAEKVESDRKAKEIEQQEDK